MYEFFRKIVCLSMHIKYRIKLIGGDNRPYKNGIKGGYIIACNHQDYGDPPLIAAVNKAHFSFMAKIELFEKNKFFAWLITKCGAFPVVRGAGDGSAIDHGERSVQCDMLGRKVWISVGEMIPAEHIALNSDDRTELRRVSNLIMDNIKMLMDGMSEYGDPLPKQYNPKPEKQAEEESK